MHAFHLTSSRAAQCFNESANTCMYLQIPIQGKKTTQISSQNQGQLISCFKLPLLFSSALMLTGTITRVSQLATGTLCHSRDLEQLHLQIDEGQQVVGMGDALGQDTTVTLPSARRCPLQGVFSIVCLSVSHSLLAFLTDLSPDLPSIILNCCMLWATMLQLRFMLFFFFFMQISKPIFSDPQSSLPQADMLTFQ